VSAVSGQVHHTAIDCTRSCAIPAGGELTELEPEGGVVRTLVGPSKVGDIIRCPWQDCRRRFEVTAEP